MSEEKHEESHEEMSEDEEEEIVVQIVNKSPELHKKILHILKENTLCLECLGRQFSYLATQTDNPTRASSLLMSITMEAHRLLLESTINEIHYLDTEHPLRILFLIAARTNFEPAKSLLKKIQEDKSKILLLPDCQEIIEKHTLPVKFECKLCDGLFFQENIDTLTHTMIEKSSVYEFSTLLVGSRTSPITIDKEDEFRARYELQNGEAFKSNFNRVIGKQLSIMIKKPVKFNNPDLTIIVNLQKEPINFEFLSISMYVKGVYKKFVRDLPQTPWHCHVCRGRKYDYKTKEKCAACNGTGFFFPTSLQDLMGEAFLDATKGKEAILHAAGREDYNARCIGTGRPFVLEIKYPMIRTIDLPAIKAKIDQDYGKKITIERLAPSTKDEMNIVKEDMANRKKSYYALVALGDPITKQIFERKIVDTVKTLENAVINQRTPIRVLQSRTDMTRKKTIYTLKAKYIDPLHIFVTVTAQGGTYIKEFISGENGRTSPSLSSAFGLPMRCEELDVFEIENKLDMPQI